MKVTLLCENSIRMPVPKGLMGEHGLSFLIEDRSITLYDTGQGVGLINNMGILGKAPHKVDQVILSHGHYDHTGGLMPFLKTRNSRVPVYLHPDAFGDKVALMEQPGRNIEVPIGVQHSREEYENRGADFKFVTGFTKITDNIFAISDVERPAGWKAWDIRLKRKQEGKILDDPFNDDLSLLLETDSGPVVLLGCAHAGIVEILDDLSSKTGHKEFHGVIGGTHLASASRQYLDRTMEALKHYKVKIVGTSHCTGFEAAAAVMSKFEDEFVVAAVGSSFEF